MSHGKVPWLITPSPGPTESINQESLMQIREVRRGMLEAVGHDVVIITQDGADPESEHAPLAVSFAKGGTTVVVRTNWRGDSAAHIIGTEAIRHVHEALGEVLRRMEVTGTVASGAGER